MKSTRQKDENLQLLNAADELGFEARAANDDHAALKLWLRMLACTTQIEDEIRFRLRTHFDTTLPRFDYLAQLYRQPEGLRMKDLSSYLMVSGANVTALTDELESSGLVERASSPTDRRSWIVRMTDQGRATFEQMASEHERWILELFQCLDKSAVAQLHQHLGALRVHVVGRREDNNR